MALDFYFNYCECHLIDESLVIRPLAELEKVSKIIIKQTNS